MSELRRSRLLLAIGCAVVYGLARLAFASPLPTLWSPHPMTQFVPASAGVPIAVVSLLLPLLFLIWNAHAAIRPYRGKLVALGVLAGVVTAGSVLYFALRAGEGPMHQGTPYAITVSSINILWLGAFWWGWSSLRKRADSFRAIALGILLFAGLAWCAFPYFGEIL